MYNLSIFYKRFNQTESVWKAESLKYPNFIAISKAPLQSLLLGPSIWEIHNDSKLCSADETYHQLMTLSACREDEFACKDGNCVSMNLRCDGRTHCQDGYDEEECRLLIAPVGYNKFLVPPAPGDNEKLTINASITIEKINIDEVDEIQFEFFI